MDRLQEIDNLQAQFQHIADRHPWIRLVHLTVDGKRWPCRLGAPDHFPNPHFGVTGIKRVGYSDQQVLERVWNLNRKVEKLLLTIVQDGLSIPDDWRKLIEEGAKERDAWGWVWWMHFVVADKGTCWFDNYAQAASNALEKLKDYVGRDAKKGKSTSKARRRKRSPKTTSLTPKQVEAWELVWNQHRGNVSAAAKQAGISRPAMKKLYDKACAKLGRFQTTIKPKTQRLAHDRRGQALVVNLDKED